MAWRQVQYFEGSRSGSIILHVGDGFYYHRNNNRPESRFLYMRCIKGDRGVSSCPGTAKALKNMMFMRHMHGHSHRPDVFYYQEVQLRRECKAIVASGNSASFGEIIQAAGDRYDNRVRMRLPLARLNPTLSRIRANIRPAVPESLGVLGMCLLEDEYLSLTKSHVIDQNMFAGICGNFGQETLSLVFITPTMRQFMCSRNRVFCDGTWRKKCKKPRCSQIYTIYGIWRHHGLPMLRALMQRKTEAAYDALLDFIKGTMPTFNPHIIMCDHEWAQLNSWMKKFAEADVLGCLWHFAVAVWRKAKELGLHALMQEEEVVCSIVRSACAIPLLPQEEIFNGLLELGWEAKNEGWMPQLKSFFEYMETEWMPRTNSLSVYGASDRTNNIAEAGNKSYNKLIKVSRPSIFSMLDCFVKLHDQAILDIESLTEGLQVTRARKISALLNDDRIRRFSEDLSTGDITTLQFLHRASRRMQGVFQEIFKF